MESEGLFIKTNEANFDITDKLFEENYKNYTDPFYIQFFKNKKVINEIKDTFLDFYNNVPYIQRCVDKDRPRAKDLPRDNKGRIIVDITKPHLLEDMDYFKPNAICFEKHGVLTLLKPNGNPNSPYGKWITEEARRCREGYVRESDGEWIPGDLYFLWNFSPQQMEVWDEDEGINIRKRGFPDIWEGHYYKAHYIWQARRNNLNSCELASRAKGKSWYAAAMLTRRIELGETSKNKTDVTCIAMASDKSLLSGGDLLLDKFQDNLDFCAEYTEFPRGRIKDTENDLKWEIGYKQNNGPKAGTQNVVIGMSSGNSPKKGRGTRAALYIMEEFGSWPNLKTVYANLRKSVKNSKYAYGLIHLQGTTGDSESDFSSAQDLVRNPDGNDIYAVDNVYDKISQGKRRFPFFFPAYINLIGHYDRNGNSNVVSALLQIISSRVRIKYNIENPAALIKETAEAPIVPAEAMMRTVDNVFPVTQLNERIGEIEGDPNFFDSTFAGKLVMDNTGNVKFESTTDIPIRFFPHNDNKLKGALEIFEMPQIDPNTKRPFANRYIASQDPVDRDVADTVSLSSTFVMDLWTDRIVAEWTGRTQFAEDGYENARLLCMFYNCKLLYENNIAGLYGYFQKMNCLNMLEETPPYLKEKDLVKTLGFGNTAYGVRTTVPIINHGERLIEAWLLAPVKTVDKNGNAVTLCNINFIKNLALLKELVMYNRLNNFDRVMALVMLMIFREAKMIMYHGDIKQETRPKGSEAAHDKFFQQYDRKFKHN